MNCDQPFTFLRRRHHCRWCGRLFCHNCSSSLVEGQRACLGCARDYIGHAHHPSGMMLGQQQPRALSSDDLAGGGLVGGGRPFRGASSRALQVGGRLGELSGGGGGVGGSEAQGRVNGDGNGTYNGSDGHEESSGEHLSLDRDELVETLRDRVAGLEAGQVR